MGPVAPMSMVSLPGTNGEFLAIQRFFPGFQAQGVEIVQVSLRSGEWRVKTWFKLPYCHRLDILDRDGIYYVICCTICTTKKSEQDWSSPGAIYAAEIPENINQPLSLVQIAGGMTRNHGYWHCQPGYTSALTSSDQGVFEVLPPVQRGRQWAISRILEKPVSDIALSDIDGDGIDELAAIERFHGSDFVVYRKTAESYAPIYRHAGDFSFRPRRVGRTVKG